MSFPGGGFEDIFGASPGPSGSGTTSRRAFEKREEKGIPWEAKVIDGKYYIPLSQVAELLAQNDVLPKVRAGIERRVKDGPPVSTKSSASERMDDINRGYRRGPND